ncbi:MAG: hypothetical protein A2W91_08965 [Bacteroidetes bacterium GWF2_38_335]|nr:MAG: hypothetical protein A2W91_08965 [Bacteroidetes bacterium GWF2_38_335]OFY80503.1 MAG: hypothetical protein A2281_08690 [Bacteroidetes bacterium RIFOXYA12_FULL_38_20]HBS85888.1 hypothetical protein [Bacteroidales bacterium]
MSRLLLFLIVVTAIFVFQDCRHEPLDDIVPSIIFEKGEALVFCDTTLQVEENFTVSAVARSNETSGRILKRFSVTRIIDGIGVNIIDSAINTGEFIYSGNFKTSEETGIEEYIFKATDEAGKTNVSRIVINKISLKPVLTFICDSGYVCNNLSMQQNRFFRAGITASVSPTTGAKLTKVVVRRKMGSLIITEVDSVLDNLSNFNASWYFVSNENVGSEEWWFLVFDENGQNKMIDFTILTNTPQTPMDESHTASFYNGRGDLNYGWNLWDDLPVNWTDGAHDKDLVNDTAYSYLLPPFYFKIMFKSANNTKFVKANYYNFAEATLEDAVDIFTGATPSDVTTYALNFEEDDVFITKLRNQNEYVAIKILNIYLTTDDELDRVDFAYKKVGD